MRSARDFDENPANYTNWTKRNTTLPGDKLTQSYVTPNDSMHHRLSECHDKSAQLGCEVPYTLDVLENIAGK